jgi:hypothetical protein
MSSDYSQSEGDTGYSGSESEGEPIEHQMPPYASEHVPPPGPMSREGIKQKKVMFAENPVSGVLEPPKRGRGRPRGSKNNKGKEKEYHLVNSESEELLPQNERWLAETQSHIAGLDKQRRAIEIEKTKLKKYEFSNMLGAGGPGFDYGGTEGLAGTDEETAEKLMKMKHLTTIEMNYKYFPYLAASCPRRTKFSLKTPLRDLEDEINRCNNEKKQRRALALMKKLDIFTNWALQQVAIHGFQVRAQGLAKLAEQDQELVEEELKELAIEWRDVVDVSPTARYFMKTMQRMGELIEKNDQVYGSKNPQVDLSQVDMDAYRDL